MVDATDLSAQAAENLRPVKILHIKPKKHSNEVSSDRPTAEVEIIKENLELVNAALQKSGAEYVSIVSVMGSYRTGKSFLLDILMRYLRHKAKSDQEKRDIDEKIIQERVDAGFIEEEARKEAHSMMSHRRRHEQENELKTRKAWTLAKNDEQKMEIPSWLRHGDAKRISEGTQDGDQAAGFEWRSGSEKVTQGIWMWTTPIVFEDEEGRKIGVLMMDTQGAWDNSLTKAQSATIFGLASLLSSKLIYNIQNRIEEDKIENLDYFSTFAQTACSQLPGAGSVFGRLQILIRDWANFEKGFSLDDCLEHMRMHHENHLTKQGVPADAAERVDRLETTFRSMETFGLPHPGLEVTRPNYMGDIDSIDSDFIFLLDVFAQELFGKQFPEPSAPLGKALSVDSFYLHVLQLAEVFCESGKEIAIGLRDAFVKVEKASALEELTKRFNEDLDKFCPEGSVKDPNLLAKKTNEIIEKYSKELEVTLKPWKLKESEEKIAVDDFRRQLEHVSSVRILKNIQQVDGATMKIVASPVIGCAAWTLMMHTWVLAGVMAVGAYFHAKKWQTQNGVEMFHKDVFAGIVDDSAKFCTARVRDLQAMQVAVTRLTASDALTGIMKAGTQAGSAVSEAATKAGIRLPGGVVGAAAGAAASSGSHLTLNGGGHPQYGSTGYS